MSVVALGLMAWTDMMVEAAGFDVLCVVGDMNGL